VYYSAAGDNQANYTVNYSGGSKTVTVDQTQHVGTWVSLGEFSFAPGTSGQGVSLMDGATGAIADAVRVVRDNSADPQPAGPNQLAYTYDLNGNLSDISDASPNAQFNDYTPTFDGLNRLTQMLEKSSGTVKHTLTYGYDADSNLTAQSQDSTSGAYTYNNLNQLTQVVDKQSAADPGVTTGYTYTPTGQLSTETKGNSNLVTDTYNLDGSLATTTEATATGTIVDQHQLEYDANLNINRDTATVQNANGGANLTNTATLTYDPNNQVTGVSNSDGHDNQTYQYDSSGNVIKQAIGTASAEFAYTHGRLYAQEANSQLTGTYQYDSLGRLDDVVGGYSVVNATIGEQYTYDGFDNILSQSQTNGSTTNKTSYTYDSLNRPITETISPGSGASQTDTIDYLGSSQTVADEQISIPNDTITKTYDYSPSGERLALLNHDPGSAPSSDQTSYYTYDQHENVEALTGPTGSTIATYGYTAYGADDKTSPTDPGSWDTGTDSLSDGTPAFPYNSYRFNAGRIATTTENLDMGARTYDPNTDSFLSRDSYDSAGADTNLAADPNNASRYAFAGGDPISNIEQDGHSWQSDLANIAGYVAGEALCNAALDVETAGAGVAVCAIALGSVIGGAASQSVTCAQGGSCSPQSYAENIGESAATNVLAAGAGAALKGLLPGAARTVAKVAAGLAAGIGLSVVSGCSSGDDDVSVGGESFSPDTKVQMADGSTKAISTLKPGDKVKSTDTKTGKTKGSTASAVLVNHDTDLYDLTVHTVKGDEVIHTTAHHLFYDKTTHSWVQAAKLHHGDQLTTDDGTAVTVAGGTTPAESSGDMWDLTVNGDHDFYVKAGDSAVLVHNCGFKDLAVAAQARAQSLATKWGSGHGWSTVAVAGLRDKVTGEMFDKKVVSLAGGKDIAAVGENVLQDDEMFVQGELVPGRLTDKGNPAYEHAEEAIFRWAKANGYEVVFGGTSRNVCKAFCAPLIEKTLTLAGKPFRGLGDKTRFRTFWLDE
jgi:RHS repeat-associated protein